jgi:hypothetical protein
MHVRRLLRPNHPDELYAVLVPDAITGALPNQESAAFRIGIASFANLHQVLLAGTILDFDLLLLPHG